MTLTTKSTSSYEDVDDYNEEEQVVDQKQQIIHQEEEPNQEEEEDDDDDDNQPTRMNLTTKSPSSYEEDDDDNEEEQVVEQKQQIIQQEEEEEEEANIENKKTNQDKEQDDLAEDDDSDSDSGDKGKEKTSTIVVGGGNSIKRSLFQSGEDSSRNPTKKQKMNEVAVAVALKAKAKRKKKKATVSRRSKLNLIQKVWSQEDVLIILEGLINYKEKHGNMLVSTTRNYAIFHQSIKDMLSFKCTVDQLKNKVKKLKDKYDGVVDKLMSGVINPNKNKPHEAELYELSKAYWGDVVKCKAKESNELPYHYLDYFSKVSSTGYCNSLSVNLPTHLVAIASKKGWEKKIGKANAEYLNKKWKDWMIADGELFVERCQVILDQTKLMLDVLKK